MFESRHGLGISRPARRGSGLTGCGLCVLALSSFAGAAAAATGPYVGVGLSQVHLDDVLGTNLHLDLNNTEPELIAGWRFNDILGTELNYLDLGSEDRTFANRLEGAHADAKQFSAFAVGYLPLPLVDVYAKAGVVRWQLNADIATPLSGRQPLAVNDNGAEFAWGLGGQIKLGPLAPRLEWVHSVVPRTSGLNLWTLAVTFSF